MSENQEMQKDVENVWDKSRGNEEKHLLEPRFNIYDIRQESSFGSVASSDAGGDISEFSGSDADSLLGILDSDNDSEADFEKLLNFTASSRQKIYNREYHVDPVQQRGKPNNTLKEFIDIEHEYDNLPPLEHLTIHCEDYVSLVALGKVTSVVDCLVVIQADVNVALNFGSLLFDEHRNSIGEVFDVFGKVDMPSYAIRFNSKEEADMIPIGMMIYYAPSVEEFTKCIIEPKTSSCDFTADLTVSDEDVMFSDDEKEKEFRESKAARRRDKMGGAESSSSDLSRKRKRGGKSRVQFCSQTFSNDKSSMSIGVSCGDLVKVGEGIDNSHSRNGIIKQSERKEYNEKGYRTEGHRWNWHVRNEQWNRKGKHQSSEYPRFPTLSSRNLSVQEGNTNQKLTQSPSSSSLLNNPYAEYGCYGHNPISDARYS